MRFSLAFLIFNPSLLYGLTSPLSKHHRSFFTKIFDDSRCNGKYEFNLWSSSIGKADDTIYSNHIQNLSYLLEEGSEMIQQMKRVCSLIKDIELNHPSVTKLGTMSTKMAQALSEAKAADDVFGPNSVEANAAYDMAEMIYKDHDPNNDRDTFQGLNPNRYKEAAVSSHHNYMTVIDLTTLRNAIDAFGTIEHLHRLVKIESKRIGELNEKKLFP